MVKYIVKFNLHFLKKSFLIWLLGNFKLHVWLA